MVPRVALAALLALTSASGSTGCFECSDCEQEFISVAYVRARVQDAAGRPLGGVAVSLSSARFSAETSTTGADGVAHVGLVGAPTGHAAVVRVSPPAGYARADSVLVTLVRDDTVAVTITLAPN